jgi:hypothetical protein
MKQNSYMSELLKEETVTSNAGKDAKEPYHSYIDGGNGNDTTILENSFSVNY